MIGFWVVNLLIPGEPDACKIRTASGGWTLEKYDYYLASKDAISRGQCAHTYAIENDVSMSNGAAACDTSLEELTSLLLGASYLSGLSVTAKTSLPYSDVSIIQANDHWPRERAIGDGNSCVNTQEEFVDNLEKFVASWPLVAPREKILILVHHWLDALGCWSFEDFYLSATTLLQIIAATQERIKGNSLYYFDAVTLASTRVGITSLKEDFKDMRNNLIHEGKLLGGKFIGKDREACSIVAADVMNWFDEYIHVVMNLGKVKRRRYSKDDFMRLNAYSL